MMPTPSLSPIASESTERAAVACCFHCGLPVPAGSSFAAVIDDVSQPMCCAGCQAVAEMIANLGLEAFYHRREDFSQRREISEPVERWLAYDDPELQREFVVADGPYRVATLAIDGMRCAACAWLIERTLADQPGVRSVQVGLATPRARVCWDPDRTTVSELLRVVSEIGYGARPDLHDEHEDRDGARGRQELRRLGVAGLGAMQVMMYAVALYAGALQGIEAEYRDFLRGTSWGVATIVVFYAAWPFFERAWRDLRVLRPGMDVPVALAIGTAYAASTVSTWTGRGEVYFDSVCMFTFFLSLGRSVERRARARCESTVRTLLRNVPETARRIDADGERCVPRRQLAPGDHVIVSPGDTIPADGIIAEGSSSLSEALVTGESAPVRRRTGDHVIGGSQNIESPLVVSVTRTGADSTLSAIASLLDRAQFEKIRIARVADRIARYFVVGLLALAVVVGCVWWQLAGAEALWVVLSLLVVTCPCALSLATPVALATATHTLAGRGFLVTRGHTLETLARIDRVVFDKTGTLTTGAPAIGSIVAVSDIGRREALARCAALEARSNHPLARAFADVSPPSHVDARRVSHFESASGCGVAARLDGVVHRLGRPEWVSAIFEGESDEPDEAKLEPPIGEFSWILLGNPSGPLAWIGIESQLRDDAEALVRWLTGDGRIVTLLSGDPSPSEVMRTAEQLGIDHVVWGATPGEKLDELRRLQRDGDVVAAVGDGVNDAPLLAGAAVSVAMGSGTDLSRTTADAVLLGDRLMSLAEAIRLARRTRRIIYQNLGWAAAYNAAAIPLAAIGAIPPYLAAIGMSASSLLVVCNSLRLGRPIRGTR